MTDEMLTALRAVVRHRDDKGADEADTIETVRALAAH